MAIGVSHVRTFQSVNVPRLLQGIEGMIFQQEIEGVVVRLGRCGPFMTILQYYTVHQYTQNKWFQPQPPHATFKAGDVTTMVKIHPPTCLLVSSKPWFLHPHPQSYLHYPGGIHRFHNKTLYNHTIHHTSSLQLLYFK